VPFLTLLAIADRERGNVASRVVASPSFDNGHQGGRPTYVLPLPVLTATPADWSDELFRSTAELSDDQLLDALEAMWAEDSRCNETGLCSECGYYTAPYLVYCQFCSTRRELMPPQRRARLVAVRALVAARGIQGHPRVIVLAEQNCPLLSVSGDATWGIPAMNAEKMTNGGRKVETTASDRGLLLTGMGQDYALRGHMITKLGMRGGTKSHGGMVLGTAVGGGIAFGATPVMTENLYSIEISAVTAAGKTIDLSLMTRKSLWSGDAHGPWEFEAYVAALLSWLPRAFRRAETEMGVTTLADEIDAADYLADRAKGETAPCPRCGALMRASATRCTGCLQSA
jgi:hypothetical protein